MPLKLLFVAATILVLHKYVCDNMRAIAAVSRIANSYQRTAWYKISCEYEKEKKKKCSLPKAFYAFNSKAENEKG